MHLGIKHIFWLRRIHSSWSYYSVIGVLATCNATHNLSVSSRSSCLLPWSQFVVSLLDCDTMCTLSVVYWRSLPIHIRGCGQFCSDILVHLRFKCIVSSWFCNRHMCLKTRVYGINRKYNFSLTSCKFSYESTKVLLLKFLIVLQNSICFVPWTFFSWNWRTTTVLNLNRWRIT